MRKVMPARLIGKLASVFFCIMLFAAFFNMPVKTFASDAQISMTADSSSVSLGDDIEVSISISAGSRIGTYYIELEYDSSRMTYKSGADNVGDGILTLTGTGFDSTVKYTIKFTASAGGEAGIGFRQGIINDASDEQMNLAAPSLVTVTVNGQSDNSASFSQKLSEEQDILDSDLALSGTIHDGAGNTYYIVDVTQTKVEGLKFDYSTIDVTFEDQTITCATDLGGVLQIIPLRDGTDTVTLYAINGNNFYPIDQITDAKGTSYYSVSLDACSTIPQSLSTSSEMWDYIIYAYDSYGNGNFYLTDSEGNLDAYDDFNGTKTSSGNFISSFFLNGTNKIPFERYLLIAAIIAFVIIILCIALFVWRYNRTKKKREAAPFADDDQEDLNYIDRDEDIKDIDEFRHADDLEKDIEKEKVSKEAKTDSDSEGAGGQKKRKSVQRIFGNMTELPKKNEKSETKSEKSISDTKNLAVSDTKMPENEDEEFSDLDSITLSDEDFKPGTK